MFIRLLLDRKGLDFTITYHMSKFQSMSLGPFRNLLSSFISYLSYFLEYSGDGALIGDRELSDTPHISFYRFPGSEVKETGTSLYMMLMCRYI